MTSAGVRIKDRLRTVLGRVTTANGYPQTLGITTYKPGHRGGADLRTILYAAPAGLEALDILDSKVPANDQLYRKLFRYVVEVQFLEPHQNVDPSSPELDDRMMDVESSIEQELNKDSCLGGDADIAYVESSGRLLENAPATLYLTVAVVVSYLPTTLFG